MTAMQNWRVLIADDSALFRKALTTIISKETGLEVAGIARDRDDCLSKVRALKPDLVTIDIEAAAIDGLDVISAIRKEWPSLPIVMFCSTSEAGREATLEGLSRGASDHTEKPSSFSYSDSAIDRLRKGLIPKIIALRARPAPLSVDLTGVRPKWHPPAVACPRTPTTSVSCVAIGSSTGGPDALAKVLSGFEARLGVPVLITQHMPPVFTRMLAERLNKICVLNVVEAHCDMVIEDDTVYIAPGDFHMLVKRQKASRVISLTQTDKENFCRPAVDPMFRSIADAYGAGVLAVVLTGMGRDGSKGATAIRDAGGQVIAQDELTSVVWGMPGSVVGAGSADEIVPIQDVAGRILARVRGRREPSTRRLHI